MLAAKRSPSMRNGDLAGTYKRQKVLSFVPSTSKMGCSREKYRGCLMGALIGDCFGSPFESIPRRHTLSTSQLPAFLNRVMNANVTKDLDAGRRFVEDDSAPHGGVYMYTDDTAMTHVLAGVLLSHGMDPVALAKGYAKEFVTDRHTRGEYGPSTRKLLPRLLDVDSRSVYQHASKLFNGSGSLGNGASMRVAPVALFYYRDTVGVTVKAAVDQARITHANPMGYNAAALVSLAIRLALSMDPTEPLDAVDFIDRLRIQMRRHVETSDYRYYTDKLTDVRAMFADPDSPMHFLKMTPQKIAALFGNSIVATRSVVSALYAFLRSAHSVPDCPMDHNGFVRTIYFAIAIGGDADTIATIAGAIAGAYYGMPLIPLRMQEYCQARERTISLADRLFLVSGAREKNE